MSWYLLIFREIGGSHREETVGYHKRNRPRTGSVENQDQTPLTEYRSYPTSSYIRDSLPFN
jgi:hypothetical protein